MFKDAAKGLCKQQSQDSASENVTVNTTTKLEQVTACSFLKCLLALRSGNCKLNEVKDHSNFFPLPRSNIICTVEPYLRDHSLQSAWPCKELWLCKWNSCSCQLLVVGQGLWQSEGSELLGLYSWFTTGEGQLLTLPEVCSCLQLGFIKERNTTWETAKTKRMSKKY